jgi:hypothetical protein
MRDVLLFAVLLALGAAIAADAQQALPATKGHVGGGSSGLTDVAFQGSGLLVNYYAGASWALQKGKVIVPGKTKLAGLSGGAYTSVVNALGWTGPEQKALCESSLWRAGHFFSTRRAFAPAFPDPAAPIKSSPHHNHNTRGRIHQDAHA